MWNFNDVQIDIDILDADAALRIEQALDVLAVEEKQLPKEGKLSEVVTAYCSMYIRFFDTVLGPGGAKLVFQGKTNVRLCDEAYASFIAHIQKETRELDRRRVAFMRKYAPKK